MDKEEQRLKGLIDQTKARLQDAKDKNTAVKDRAGQIGERTRERNRVRDKNVYTQTHTHIARQRQGKGYREGRMLGDGQREAERRGDAEAQTG